MDSSERLLCVALVLAYVMVVFVVVSAVLGSLTVNECMSYGYRTGNVTITMARYCETRLEQTDVVVPLSEARAKHAKGTKP